ncbi:F-box domain [Arabidopsis suecica]|uniref:F-box domain n=1 Tax=Arabidopsis suecica TaxID=45249 RepID=A0A8T2BF42_ARASU|nr:F-box domain [Arabidopsis suecica]
METPNPLTLSALPHDLLRSIFERLSFADFHRAKIVCSTWNSISKQTVPKEIRSPWLILFPDDGVNGCVLYNPDEDRIYKSVRDFSGTIFLANSGNWFLVMDSKSNLYLIDVFSENRIDLPPLESLMSDNFTFERKGDKKFRWQVTNLPDALIVRYPKAEELRGLLWVDEKTEEFVAVWFFEYSCNFLAFHKKGDDHYRHIQLQSVLLPDVFVSVSDIVLRGYFLYIARSTDYIQILDLSKQQGFEDVTQNDSFNMLSRSGPWGYQIILRIVVTTSGEVLVVINNLYETNIESRKSFRLFKKDPIPHPNKHYNSLVEVDSLGDEEALLLDLGITVPGIEPNSIYFTRYDRVFHQWDLRDSNLDICVFNLETKTLKRFPSLSDMKLKDARWFLPCI